MTDYILLAAAITFAVPYAYLLIAIIVVQPRLISSYLVAAGLLLFWPSCLFMSFMQVIPVAMMTLWWWTSNFESNPNLSIPMTSKRPMPTGLKIMFVCTIIGALIATLVAWNAYTIDNRPS